MQGANFRLFRLGLDGIRDELEARQRSSAEEKAEIVAPVEETEEQGEKEFEKIFSLQNVLSAPPAEEESEEERNKKKEKKAKKSRELEFDEKRGEVVARKKHKLGDDDSVLEEWE